MNSGIWYPWIMALAINPANPTTLYAGTFYGVFKSTDAGGYWNRVSTGLPYGPVHALAVDPQTPTTLYAGTSNGSIFKSVNGGENWAPAGVLASRIVVFAINPLTPDTLYVGTANHGVFKSADGGASWGAVNKGLTNLDVSALALDPETPTTL
jgi:photosystem II stability/assembly factor-like uncharacterized protein